MSCPYVFSPFSTAITSLGEERAGLCAFRAFVCFVLVGLYLFPLRHGVKDWLRLVRFAGASSSLGGFGCRNKALTAKLLRQGYRYFKLRKAFSKFYRRHSALLEKYSVSLKTLLQQGISEPEFYGD